MREFDERSVTQAVIGRLAQCDDPRFKRVMTSLIALPHTHDRLGGRILAGDHDLFVAGSQYLDSDAVFGMKESLVAQFDRHPPGAGPNGECMDTAFYTVNFDFRLRNGLRASLGIVKVMGRARWNH